MATCARTRVVSGNPSGPLNPSNPRQVGAHAPLEHRAQATPNTRVVSPAAQQLSPPFAFLLHFPAVGIHIQLYGRSDPRCALFSFRL